MAGCKLIGSREIGFGDQVHVDHVENEGQPQNGMMARWASWITWNLHRVPVKKFKPGADPPDY